MDLSKIRIKLLYLFTNFIFFYSNISTFTNSYRYEPFSFWKARYAFNEENFKKNNVDSNLKLSYNHEKGFYCKAVKDIQPETPVFSIPYENIISLFDDYPFKKSLYYLLSGLEFEEIGMLNKNFTANFMLSLRLLYEIKVNHTRTFIELKKEEVKENKNFFYIYQETNFTQYRDYLKERNKNGFLKKYFSMLPLHYMYSQTAFYTKGDEDYSKSGYIKPIVKMVEQIYLTLADKIENYKLFNNTNENEYNTLDYKLTAYSPLFRIIKHWFNKENVHIFKSAFAFVSSRSFKHSLEDYISYNHNTENIEMNNELDDDGNGVPYLIPSIDLCNHYHPKKVEEAGKNNLKDQDKYKLKLIKIKPEASNQPKNYIIHSTNFYFKDEEFNFSYSRILDNDFLLLNYGFVIQDNPFHSYYFNFQFKDENKTFYNYLFQNKFNMEIINLKSDVLTIGFKLQKDIINHDLLDFIGIYLKHTELIDGNSPKNNVKGFLVYFRSIEKNLMEIFESNLSIKAKNTTSLLFEIQENDFEINRLQFELDKTYEVEHEFTNKDTREVYTSMDLLIKTNNILKFHLENVLILESHKKIILENLNYYFTNSIYGLNNLDNLKKKYLSKIKKKKQEEVL